MKEANNARCHVPLDTVIDLASLPPGNFDLDQRYFNATTAKLM
jgi:hypothetical protein